MTDLSAFFVRPDSSLREVIARIDQNRKGIALVVDDDRRLMGTITDGDVRRALLAGRDLDWRADDLLAQKPPSTASPVTAAAAASPAELLDLMQRHDLRHVPVLDVDGRVAGVTVLSDLLEEYRLPLRAVIMAGGLGTRLRPLTDDTPKAMLPVGDRPLLEHIVRQLKDAGIHRMSLATHYRGDLIRDHFGDGRDFSVDIQYVDEDQPLGTAGALGLLAQSDEPLLVMNGDILTQVDFRAMLEFHVTHGADLTMAVRQVELQVPYGVVETRGVEVVHLSEKPVARHLINAGIYLLNPDVHRFVPAGQRSDMTDLIARLIADRRRVISFPIRESWIDIGQPQDYTRAVELRGRE
jgi:dTDP-glucose pyrophosphorylase/predicted transcriptional regulator